MSKPSNSSNPPKQSTDQSDQPARELKHSSLYRHVFAEPASEELDSWRLFLRKEWHWLVIALVGILVLVTWVKPLPPSQVFLAVGAEHSALARLGERYIPPFEEAGIELELVLTEPAEVLDAQSQANIDAAFVIGGMVNETLTSGMVSLGSVEYAPLWVFYRGEIEPGKDFFDAFAAGLHTNTSTNSHTHIQARISAQPSRIGLAGPASRAIIGQMARLRGIELSAATGFDPVSNRLVVDRFLEGELDVVVIVDGYDSHHISRLIAANDAKLFDMSFAAAYQRHLPYLEIVTVPRGALSLEALTPQTDVNLLASTVSLLVHARLHAAAQQLFLTVTDEFDQMTEPFFARPGFFPAYLDPEVPLSTVAKRFYSEGGLPLSQRLPYWLASLIDRLWLLVLGLLAVIYPLFRLVPRYRVLRSEMQISDAYKVMRAIDAASNDAQTCEQLERLRADLNQLEKRLQGFWISSESMRWYYTLRNTLNQLRQRLDMRIAQSRRDT